MPNFIKKAPEPKSHVGPIRWSLAAVTGGIVAAAATRRAGHMAAVAPELRAPLLLVPFSINGLTRALIQRAAKVARIAKPAGLCVTEHQVPGGAGESPVRLLTFEREGSSGQRPVLFWMHGGGYVIGRPEQDMAFMARLLARFDIVVISVDYRLAPDHPFPAPLDDCHASLTWMAQNAGELGIDPARLVIGGQSAGGGLAAALVQRAVDQGPVTPKFQLLIYPMLDAMTVGRQDDAGTGQFVWTRKSNHYGWQSYLGADPTSGSYPDYAVPAARTDLTALPPAWIGVGSLDLFYAEDCAYAERLRQSGVACELYVSEDAYHGFDIFFPDAAATMRFNESMFTALEKALG